MCQNHMHKIKKKTYAQSQNLTSPGLSADCDGLALGHPHMHSRVSSRTGWTPWPTENTLSRIRRTQLPVRWKKSFSYACLARFIRTVHVHLLRSSCLFWIVPGLCILLLRLPNRQHSMLKLSSICDEISFNSIHDSPSGWSLEVTAARLE